MRLEVDLLPDNTVRLSSPDVPGMVRTARGMDQLWREFRVFVGAHRGVQAGTWKAEGDDAFAELLADAENATSSKTRAEARRVRAAFDRLKAAIEANREAERAEQERLAAIEKAEKELRDAERTLAQKREALRGLKRKKKGTPLASPGVTVPSAKAVAAQNRVQASPEEIRKRRADIAELQQLGVTSQAEIARRLDLSPKTVANDVRAMSKSAA